MSLLRIPDDLTLEEALFKFVEDNEAIGIFPEPLVYSTYIPVSDPGSIGANNWASCGTAGSLHDNDPKTVFVAGQWALDAINVADAWNKEGAGFPTGAGVKVIVADHGVSVHEDMPNGTLLPGRNLLIPGTTDGQTTDSDPGGHGTAVASIIAAPRNNGGMAGVAPDARIIPYRVLYRNNASTGFSVVRAMLVAQAAQRKDPSIKVINFSLAEPVELVTAIPAILLGVGTLSPQWLAAASAVYAWERDVGEQTAQRMTVVASAGNSRLKPWAAYGSTFPATLDGSISVGEVWPLPSPIHPAPSTTADSTVDIAAPGRVIAAHTFMPNMLKCFTGTSASAPHVAGAAAVLYSIPGRPISPAQVRQFLKETATKLAFEPSLVGAGLLDVGAAAQRVLDLDPPYFTYGGRTVGAPVIDTAFAGNNPWFLLPDGLAVASDPGAQDFVGVTVSTTGLPFSWLVGDPAPTAAGDRLMLGAVGTRRLQVTVLSGAGATSSPVAMDCPGSCTLSGEGVVLSNGLQNQKLVRLAVVPVTEGVETVDLDLAQSTGLFPTVKTPLLVAGSTVNLPGSQRHRLAIALATSSGPRLQLAEIDLETRAIFPVGDPSKPIALPFVPIDMAVVNAGFTGPVLGATPKDGDLPIVIVGGGAAIAIAGIDSDGLPFVRSLTLDQIGYAGVLPAPPGPGAFRAYLYVDGRIDTFDPRTATKLTSNQSPKLEVFSNGSISVDGTTFAFSGGRAEFDPNNQKQPWFYAQRFFGF